MVKKSFSHYAPRPLQQPQMPDMEQVKRSVCNHIRHFSLLSFPPRQFRRAPASSYQPTPQSPSFHQPRHTLQTHSSPPPPTGNSFVPTALTPHPANTGVSEKLCWCESRHVTTSKYKGAQDATVVYPHSQYFYDCFFFLIATRQRSSCSFATMRQFTPDEASFAICDIA